DRAQGDLVGLVPPGAQPVGPAAHDAAGEVPGGPHPSDAATRGGLTAPPVLVPRRRPRPRRGARLPPMSTPTTTQYHELDVIRRGRSVSEPLGHLAPLAGIRAIAVVAVLLYHALFPWIPGSYLGVSTFFALSGFLIT